MNSPRTMPWVFVFPPRSMPPGFQSLRICFSKLAMIESTNASSSGSSFSSAIFKPSLGRLLVDQRRDEARDRIAQQRRRTPGGKRDRNAVPDGAARSRDRPAS